VPTDEISCAGVCDLKDATCGGAKKPSEQYRADQEGQKLHVRPNVMALTGVRRPAKPAVARPR